MFGPANIVDAMNRIRGPFNVSVPAQLAAVAAIEDTAHVDKSLAHTIKWRDRLTEEFTKLGLTVTPSVCNFVLVHFPHHEGPDRGGRRCVPHPTRPGAAGAEQLRPAARAADDDRHRRGQRAGDRGVARVRGQAMSEAPLFQRVALIGFGLIGGSIARGARAQNLAGEIVATARSAASRARGLAETRHRRPRGRDQCGSREGRRSRHPVHSGRRLRRRGGGDRGQSEARRDRLRRRFGESRGGARDGRASAGACAFRAGASGRRHREFRPRFRLRRTLHQPLVHSDAAGRHR